MKLAVAAALLITAPLAAQAPDSVQRDSVGRLFQPAFVQQQRPTDARDDDPVVKALEKKLRCTCGCNLDVFTCRTTDFTCGTSPAMHQVVLARMDSGMTAEQVVQAFETQYGQSVLMQPPRRGFNWTAYLMPFVGLGIGMGLLGMAMRRVVQRHRVETAVAAESPQTPVSVSPEDLANLKRELDKFEA